MNQIFGHLRDELDPYIVISLDHETAACIFWNEQPFFKITVKIHLLEGHVHYFDQNRIKYVILFSIIHLPNAFAITSHEQTY